MTPTFTYSKIIIEQDFYSRWNKMEALNKKKKHVFVVSKTSIKL